MDLNLSRFGPKHLTTVLLGIVSRSGSHCPPNTEADPYNLIVHYSPLDSLRLLALLGRLRLIVVIGVTHFRLVIYTLFWGLFSSFRAGLLPYILAFCARYFVIYTRLSNRVRQPWLLYFFPCPWLDTL